MLKIVADSNIPKIGERLADVAQLDLMAGEDITRSALRGAEILLVRSVTPVGPDLLDGSDVRFVGTATAGVDHVDTAYLERKGIKFAHAPGSNARAVVDYVLAAVFSVAAARDISVRRLRAGIVGFGNVGSRLAARLQAAGIEVVVNDPPLQESTPGFAGGLEVTSLAELLAGVDLVTLHVPLTHTGPHPTASLIESKELELVGHHTMLINTSRGSVVDSEALMARLDSESVGPVVLDVFENEPEPNRRLVGRLEIATPHIAGYALDSKLEGSRALTEAVRRFLGLNPGREDDEEEGHALPLVPPTLTKRTEEQWADELIRQMYDIRVDSRNLKVAAAHHDDLAASFRELRRNHPERRTFGRYQLDCTALPDSIRTLAAAIGVRIFLDGSDQNVPR